MLILVTNDEIILFVRDQTAIGDETISPDTDIFNELGCTGDDFHELIDAYQKKFSVDMTDYLWYFHADEEGGSFNLGSIFSRPPYERVKRIPVTPQMLTDFAHIGKWEIKYPEHKLPKYRYDIWMGHLLWLVVLFFAIKSCLK